MPNFGDLIRFIERNRKDKCFQNDSLHDIIFEVRKGLADNTLYYSMDVKGNITGMILAEIKPNNVLFITENLSMNLSNLKAFAKMAKERFPNLRLEWLKHGIHKKHDTQKLYRKLGV